MWREAASAGRVRRSPVRWVAALVLLVGVGFSANAGRASFEQLARPEAAPAVTAHQQLLDAATSPADQELGAPAPGVTGTTALPDLPRSAAQLSSLSGDASITPARPFRMRGSPNDAMRALECLTTAIYYEAASEPENGQRAVAQVILNRVRHPAFPATVCGVIYQGSDRQGCQFSYACDGAMARRPQPAAWTRAARVAAAALYGGVYAPVGLATHYHTYAVTPKWNRSLVMTGVEGAHFFHRWKGWWGTAAAFRDRYTGGEPMPGPLRPAMPVVAAAANLAPDVAIASPSPPPAVPPVQSATPAGEAAAIVPARDDVLPAAPVILEKWKDSGRLRM